MMTATERKPPSKTQIKMKLISEALRKYEKPYPFVAHKRVLVEDKPMLLMKYYNVIYVTEMGHHKLVIRFLYDNIEIDINSNVSVSYADDLAFRIIQRVSNWYKSKDFHLRGFNSKSQIEESNSWMYINEVS